MPVRNKLPFLRSPVMSRIFIANIYFQIICGFPNFPCLKRLLKVYWAASRNTYHCLVYFSLWYLGISHCNTRHMRIHSGTFPGGQGGAGVRFLCKKRPAFSQFIPTTKHAGNQAPPDKHNRDRLTKHCCFHTPNKHTLPPQNTCS